MAVFRLGDFMKETTPVYIYLAAYAHEHGELDQYRASHRANITCKEAIEQAIADHYRDNRLNPACVQQVLQQFDSDRIFYVLANTVRQKQRDGRISATIRHGRRQSRSARIWIPLALIGTAILL